MKKLLLLIFCFATVGTFAQKGLHLGVFGGPVLSSQLNQQDFDYSEVRYDGITVRGGAGFSVNYHFTDRVGLGTQVVYSQQGLKYENRAGTPFMRKTSYIKLPILFHVNSPSDKLVGGYFYIGPQFSFLVGKDFVFDGESLKEENPQIYDTVYSGLHKKFTFGAAMGFGIVFNVLDGKLLINAGLRLDADFLDAYKGKDFKPIPNPTYVPVLPQDEDNYKYLSVGQEGFAMDPSTGKRKTTYNVGGMVEIGIRYVLFHK